MAKNIRGLLENLFEYDFLNTIVNVDFFPSRHGCILDPSLRHLIQSLRGISKRAYLQISETSSGRSVKDVSLEASLRSLCFSQRPL